MGGDLNLKKSWHPSLMVNQRRVWEERKKASDEKKHIEQLRKERAEERNLEELQDLQDAAGGKKRTKRVDFLYNGPGSGPDGGVGEAMTDATEAYLLGTRRLDTLMKQKHNGDIAALSKSTDFVPAGPDEHAELSSRELDAKISADPLFAMKKKKQVALDAILADPVRRKQMAKALGIALPGDQSRDRDRDQGRDRDRDGRSHRDRDRRSDRDRPRHRDDSHRDRPDRHRRRHHSDDSYSDTNSDDADGRRHRQQSHPTSRSRSDRHSRRERSPSASPDRNRHRSSRSTRNDGPESRHSSRRSRHDSPSRSQSPPRRRTGEDDHHSRRRTQHQGRTTVNDDDTRRQAALEEMQSAALTLDRTRRDRVTAQDRADRAEEATVSKHQLDQDVSAAFVGKLRNSAGDLGWAARAGPHR